MTGVKKFRCTVCDKTLSCQRTFLQHQAIHADITLYNCEHCGQGFRQTSNLYRHISRMHKMTYSYECDLCGKRFKSDQNLRSHLISHSDNRNHACNQCIKRFNRKSDLNRHLRTHNQFDRRVCTVCQKTFSDISCLRRHEKKHQIENGTDGIEEIETNFENQAYYDWLLSFSEALKLLQAPLDRKTYLKAAKVLNEVQVRLCTADGPVLSYKENYEALSSVAGTLCLVLKRHQEVLAESLELSLTPISIQISIENEASSD